MRVNNNGYVIRKSPGGAGIERSWWLVKYNGENASAVDLGHLKFPKKFIGKKVRIKIEIIEDKE